MSDSTVRRLRELGLPVTRENWLRLECMGNPPDELDGEIEAMIDEIRESLPGGDWEPTTLSLTSRDRKLLRQMGIAAEPAHKVAPEVLECVQIFDPPLELPEELQRYDEED
jgi:hypothetical protein